MAGVLLPQDPYDRRTMWVVWVVRSLLTPLVGLAIVGVFSRLGILPADPVCRLAILVQSCMPSAQNLVLVMQLEPGTRDLAPKLARLLLRLYTLAILPMTVWMTVFASTLPPGSLAA